MLTKKETSKAPHHWPFVLGINRWFTTQRANDAESLSMPWINHMLGSRGAFNYIMKCLASWLRWPHDLLSTHCKHGLFWPEPINDETPSRLAMFIFPGLYCVIFANSKILIWNNKCWSPWLFYMTRLWFPSKSIAWYCCNHQIQKTFKTALRYRYSKY